MTDNETKLDAGGALALVREILRGTPRLADALCKGRPHWHDDTASEQERAAARLRCSTCPVHEPCRQWLMSTPDRHVTGTVAGELVQHPEVRGVGRPRGGQVKSHCKRAHELTGDNVYTTPGTGARSLTCKTAAARKRYAK